MPKRSATPVEVVLSRTTVTEKGCWLWNGSPNRSGYGQIKVDGRWPVVHKIVYEAFVGPVPEGMQLDHLCHDPRRCTLASECPHRRCVRPSHMLPATPRENTLRSNAVTAVNAARTHCVNGHEFTEANTYVRPTGGRMCRACGLAATKRYAVRKSSL
jgi:hypothetical protein